MAEPHGPSDAESSPELASVAEAAGRRLRAEVDGDDDAADAGARSVMKAATSAMSTGYSLIEITQAEARGKAELRNALRPDVLKQVSKSGRQMREAQAEHHRAIARAFRLGLSTRQIAAAADVTHGTVRAIVSRVAEGGTAADLSAETAN